MVETFDKTARLPIEEIIRDLLKPVVERDQEAVKTSVSFRRAVLTRL